MSAMQKTKMSWIDVERPIGESTVQVSNKPSLVSDKVKVLMALCPLYAQGTLRDSRLLQNPKSIEESRVGGKWTVYSEIISRMSESLLALGVDLELKIVFADTGILLGHEPTKDDTNAVNSHNYLYMEEVSKLLNPKGIPYTYTSHSELGVTVPRFFNTQEKTPIRGTITQEGMIEKVNSYLKSIGSEGKIKQTNDSRRVVFNFMNMNSLGLDMAFWLMAGYVGFDYKIPQIAGNDGIYMQSERFGQLLQLAKLTEELKSMARINILTK